MPTAVRRPFIRETPRQRSLLSPKIPVIKLKRGHKTTPATPRAPLNPVVSIYQRYSSPSHSPTTHTHNRNPAFAHSKANYKRRVTSSIGSLFKWRSRRRNLAGCIQVHTYSGGVRATANPAHTTRAAALHLHRESRRRRTRLIRAKV